MRSRISCSRSVREWAPGQGSARPACPGWPGGRVSRSSVAVVAAIMTVTPVGGRVGVGAADALQQPLDEGRVDEGVPGGDVGDGLGQRGAADLLEQVARSAGHDRGEQGVVVVVGGEDEAAGAGAAHLHLAADVDAAPVGQPSVEQGDLRRERGDAPQRLGGGPGLADDPEVVVRLEQVDEPAPDDLVVVEQEDRDRRRHLPGRALHDSTVPLSSVVSVHSPCRARARLARLSRPRWGRPPGGALFGTGADPSSMTSTVTTVGVTTTWTSTAEQLAVLDDVGQRLSQHGCDVVEQRRVEHGRHRPLEPQRRFEAEAGRGGPHDLQQDGPGVQGRPRLLQCEDRGPDPPDRLVEVLDGSTERLTHGGVGRSSRDGLQRQLRGEDPLDDVVVEVTRDPVAVLEHGDARLVAPPVRELERQRRVQGQLFGHLDVRATERTAPGAACDDDRTAHARLSDQGARHRGTPGPVRDHGRQCRLCASGLVGEGGSSVAHRRARERRTRGVCRPDEGVRALTTGDLDDELLGMVRSGGGSDRAQQDRPPPGSRG